MCYNHYSPEELAIGGGGGGGGDGVAIALRVPIWDVLPEQ